MTRFSTFARPASRIVLCGALAAVLAGLAGCGSDDTTTRSTTTQTTTPAPAPVTPMPGSSTTTTTTQERY